MPPALLLLFRLQRQAAVRRVLRNLQTTRGAIFALVGGGLVAAWLGANLVATMTASPSELETTRTVTPVLLLGLWVLNLASLTDEKAIYFSPAEANFLFAGPFTRRQLLYYRLISVGASVALTALFFTFVFLRQTAHWLAAYIGIFMALLFIQLFTMACVLIAQNIGQRAFTRARRLLLGGVVILLAYGLQQAIRFGASEGFTPAVAVFRQSWPGRIALAPFEVFTRVITASTFVPELLLWGGLAALVNAAVLALVLRLDVDFIESSLNQSQRIYDRLQNIRRGGALAWSGRKASSRIRLPQFPRLGGSGPIAWRQLTTALRNSRVFLILLVLLIIVTCPVLIKPPADREDWIILCLPIAWVSVLLTARMTFDFRGDLDHMDSLKSLPIPPATIVLGELATPVLILTLLHAVLLVLLGVFGQANPVTLLIVAVYLLPVNLILFEVDNLLFLIFPTRAVASGPADFQFIGRTMLLALAKLILFVFCLGVAGVVGLACYWLFGDAALLFGLATWIMLAAVAAGLIPCLVAAFRRFDLSMETPP